MYNEHFGLKQAPFRITPDTRLFHDGGGRGEILDALVYAIVSGEGIVKVIGEVGTGKTMLCRMLEERLPGHVEIVYLANPSLKPDDILQAIALEMDLDIPANANRLKVMHALQQRLLEKHAGGRQVVVFIEEAQSMPLETLEEIRLLSNLETEREKLLQIVLFGQPELDLNLDRANIRQLKERITHSFYLAPLDRREVRAYVNHRMRAVGYRGPDVLRSNAYARLARASEGLTRRINILADKALLSAFAADRHEVRLKDVRKAIRDCQFDAGGQRRGLALAAIFSGLAVAAVAVWTLLGAPGPSGHAGPETTAGAAASTSTAAPQPDSDGAAAADIAAVPAAPAPPATPGPDSPTSEAEARKLAAAVETATAKMLPVKLDARVLAAGRAAALSPGPPPVRRDPPAPEAEARPAANHSVPRAQAAAPAAGEQAPRDLISTRLAVTRQWLEQADNNHYSIQLLLTAPSQRRRLESFLEQRSHVGEIDDVYVYETVIDERPYLGVLYREFSSYSAAKEALENLPSELKRLGPFIRNVSDITTVG